MMRLIHSHVRAIIPILWMTMITACHFSSKVESELVQDTRKETSVSSLSTLSPPRSPLLRSRDVGTTWEDVSLDLPTDLQVSFMEKKGEEMVIATDNKGVFISQEKRSHWEQISANLPNQKINALHIAGQSIYVGSYRSGIYQSQDEGATWTSLNYDLANLTVQSILKVKDVLFVGTDAGIFSLGENSNQWTTSTVTAQVLSLYEQTGMLVAGSSQGTLLSKDMGETWNWIRREGAVHYSHPIGERIVELQLNGDLIYSDDWGETWQETIYQPRQGSYVYEIEQVGDFQVMSNNYGIHRSTDQGKTWQLVYPTEAMGFFDFLVDGDKIYGGTRAWNEYRKQ